MKETNNLNLDNIFFLRGHPRSGTNWLGRVLNLHPDINCHGEFHLESFGNAKRKVEASVSCFILEDRKAELDQHYEIFIKSLVRQFCGSDHKIVGDRTPVAVNTVIVPNAKYLVISRDGRDVIVSWFKHILNIATKHKNNISRYKAFNEAPKMTELALKISEDPAYIRKNKRKLLASEKFFRNIAKKWNDRIINDHKAAAFMQKHFENLEVMWINYEELHANIETKRSEIYSFLGADPSKSEELNDLTMPGYNNQSSARGKVGKWMDYFSEEKARWFDEEASEALQLLGYGNTLELFKTQSEVNN